MKRPLSLDTLAVGLMLALVASIGLVILIGTQMGIRSTANLPDGRLVSPFQVITLTFSEAVDPDLTGAQLTIQPQVAGRVEWADPRTLRFIPTQPFSLDTNYELTLHSGVIAPGGHKLKRNLHWKFQVRKPLFVVLRSTSEDSGLWAVDLDGKTSYRITSESRQVIDYDAARSGDFLVYSTLNEQGGINLWRVSRAGGDDQVLLDCGLDRCTLPAISPEGARVAYTREAAGPSIDLPFGAPRIWMLNIANRQNNAVYEDQQIIGYGPSWSPDGTRLTSYDALANQIRILDLNSAKQFVLSSAIGDSTTWSPDGKLFLYTDVEKDENSLRFVVRRADLTINKTDTLIGTHDERNYFYSSLAWSPLGDKVVLGLRIRDETPGQELWVFDPVVLDGLTITSAEETTYNAPSWNPWGTALIFQEFRLRGEYIPEVGLWAAGDTETHVLTEGLMPHWLP